MKNLKKREDLSDKIKVALDKATRNVIADKEGNSKKIPAKDL